MEQPKYAPVMSKMEYLRKNFDVLLTYELGLFYSKSDIPNLPMTYFPLNIVAVEAILQPPRPFNEKNGINPEKKDVLVSVFASNCRNAGAAQRLDYLSKLMDILPVRILQFVNQMNNYF